MLHYCCCYQSSNSESRRITCIHTKIIQSTFVYAPSIYDAKSTSGIYFLKYEDEILRDNAELSFTFPATRVGDSRAPAHDTAFGQESYIVSLVGVDKLPACIESMRTVLTGEWLKH